MGIERMLGAPLAGLSTLNDHLHAVSKRLAWMALALMTAIILAQVWYRYALNAALPWPEEAARALMIWMAALAAPIAYREGAFVAIDSLPAMLRGRVQQALKLVLLVLALVVLWRLFELSLSYFERGFRTNTASLRLPWDPAQKLKRAWIYLAMPVCFGGLLLVNVELLLRTLSGAPSHRDNSDAAPGAE